MRIPPFGWYLKYLVILLMAEILANQLRLIVYPIIYKVLAPSQVVVWDFWTINSKAPKHQPHPRPMRASGMSLTPPTDVAVPPPSLQTRFRWDWKADGGFLWDENDVYLPIIADMILMVDFCGKWFVDPMDPMGSWKKHNIKTRRVDLQTFCGRVGWEGKEDFWHVFC